jgi:hypothetical protein
MSSSGQKRKRQGEVIDGVIAFAEVTKTTGASLSVLAPLKGAMETLVTLLQNAKVSGGEGFVSEWCSQYRFRKLRRAWKNGRHWKYISKINCNLSKRLSKANGPANHFKRS